MKLVYNTLNMVFNLCNGRNNYIVVESPYWFEKFIRELYDSVTQKKEGCLLFDESDKRLDMHKICEFIISPLDLSFDKREIQKKLFNELEVIVHDNGLIDDYCNIQSEIIQLFDALQGLSEYDLDFYDEFDLLSWFKASNIQIQNVSANIYHIQLELRFMTSPITLAKFLSVTGLQINAFMPASLHF